MKWSLSLHEFQVENNWAWENSEKLNKHIQLVKQYKELFSSDGLALGEKITWIYKILSTFYTQTWDYGFQGLSYSNFTKLLNFKSEIPIHNKSKMETVRLIIWIVPHIKMKSTALSLLFIFLIVFDVRRLRFFEYIAESSIVCRVALQFPCWHEVLWMSSLDPYYILLINMPIIAMLNITNRAQATMACSFFATFPISIYYRLLISLDRRWNLLNIMSTLKVYGRLCFSFHDMSTFLLLNSLAMSKKPALSQSR